MRDCSGAGQFLCVATLWQSGNSERQGHVNRSAPGSTKRTNLRGAAAWSYAQNLGRMAITSGLTLILAAFLGPRVFGVMSLALAFTGLIEMLQKQGLAPAIVSRKELTGPQADTAFWLVVGIGMILTGIGVVIAPVWAGMNDLPELAGVVRVLACGIPITSLVVVQEALLTRELAFKALAVRTWVSAAIGGIVGVVGALLSWGVWALVAQQLTTSVVAAIVLWGVATWRPRLRVDLAAARTLWSYSMRSAGGSIGVFLGGRLDVLMAGPLFGPVIVGLYRMANRLTTLVVDISARSMQAVALPGLSALQDDIPAFRDRLLSMTRATTLLCMPALGIVIGMSDSIETILGAEWHGVSLAIRLVAIGQLATSGSLLIGPALQAVGRPGLTSLLAWCWVGTSALAIAGAAAFGSSALVSICAGLSLSAIISTTSFVAVGMHIFRFKARRMWVAWFPGMVGGIAGALSSAAVAAVIAGAHSWARAVLAGASGLAMAAIAVLLAAPDLRRALRSQVRRRRQLARTV